MKHVAHYLQHSLGFVVRKFQGRTEGAALFRSTTCDSAIARPSLLSTALVFAAILFVPLLILGVIALVAHGGDHASAYTMAFPAVVGSTRKSGSEEKKPAKIREMESNLKALVKELEEGQTEMAAGPITQERGEELEAKAHEMEELQGHIDRYNKIAGITRKAHQTERVTLPGEGEPDEGKSIYTTPGHLFVASDEFKLYRAQSKQGWSGKVSIGKRLGKKTRITGDVARAFEKKAFDPSMLSTLGDDAIVQVDRDNDLVRFEEPEVLTIRDVLNVVPTSSDAIKFVKHVSTTRNAGSQATRGAAKEYLKVVFSPDTVSVETIAVLSKVTEQDIDDAPRLVGYINGEMTLDVKVEEERQLLWGSGADGEIKGLFHADFGVPEFDRAGLEDTVIDIIRRMRTDLRKKHVTPSFTTIDPLDWEQIELTKGTDDHYIWGLVSDLRGPRIWSLRVVESDAMTNAETNERRVLVGDGVRGATIYDRNAIQLAVGYVDDDFARNLRTLRAEERLALAVKRAFAFEYAITSPAAS